MATPTGVGPPDHPAVTFLHSHHRKKAFRRLRFNRRGITDLVGFAEQRRPIQALAFRRFSSPTHQFRTNFDVIYLAYFTHFDPQKRGFKIMFRPQEGTYETKPALPCNTSQPLRG
jgi:hypothetical protein